MLIGVKTIFCNVTEFSIISNSFSLLIELHNKIISFFVSFVDFSNSSIDVEQFFLLRLANESVLKKDILFALSFPNSTKLSLAIIFNKALSVDAMKMLKIVT